MLLYLRPDALQRLPEAFGLGGGALRVPAEEGGQSPELETRSDCKDHPGNQHPQGTSHHAACCFCAA
jgi:hypothetical protein